MQDKTSKLGKKQPINLSIDAELAGEAKAAGMNLSAVLERALREELRVQRAAKWKDENRAAIESSNRYVEKHGLPLAKYRTW